MVEPHVDLLAAAQPQPLQQYEKRRQPQGQGREENVKAQGEGKLQAGKKYRIEFHRLAFRPASDAGYLGTGRFKGGRLIIQRANRNAGTKTSARNISAPKALASTDAQPAFRTSHNSAKYEVPLTTEKSMANSRKAASGLTSGCLARRT